MIFQLTSEPPDRRTPSDIQRSQCHRLPKRCTSRTATMTRKVLALVLVGIVLIAGCGSQQPQTETVGFEGPIMAESIGFMGDMWATNTTFRMDGELIGCYHDDVGPDECQNVTNAGGGCLLLSICFGVVTVTETDLQLGPRSQYLDRLLKDDFEDSDAWQHHLVLTSVIWIDDNATTVRINAWFLLATQLALISGVVLVTIGVPL